MVKITPDPPPTSKSPLSKAAQQALDEHCLDPSSSLAHALFEVRHSITCKEALITASEVLDCANATAYEAADGLCGASGVDGAGVGGLRAGAQGADVAARPQEPTGRRSKQRGIPFTVLMLWRPVGYNRGS